MDELNPIKSMLKDLITPIVKDAVTQALNVNESTATKHHIPIKEAIRIYGLSSSNIYRRFDEGTLTKVKNGGLTAADMNHSFLFRAKNNGTREINYTQDASRMENPDYAIMELIAMYKHCTV